MSAALTTGASAANTVVKQSSVMKVATSITAATPNTFPASKTMTITTPLGLMQTFAQPSDLLRKR